MVGRLDASDTGVEFDCTVSHVVGMGDRVVELGIIVCNGLTEISRSSNLINPGRLIPSAAQQVHSISEQDVSGSLFFK